MLWVELKSYGKNTLINLAAVIYIVPHDNKSQLFFAASKGDAVFVVTVDHTQAEIEEMLELRGQRVSR